jgi:hypothetical protein
VSSCELDRAACHTNFNFKPSDSWRVHALLRAEYSLMPALSVGAGIDLDLRGERSRFEVQVTVEPTDPPVVPWWRAVEVRPSVGVDWAFTERFGVTITGAVAAMDAAMDAASYGRASGLRFDWEVGLSVWFRTDARLRRAWLER